MGRSVGRWRGEEADQGRGECAGYGVATGRVTEPGKYANWIAPPVVGINRQPIEFEYVRFG